MAEIRDDEIDVEAIMREIRENLKRRRTGGEESKDEDAANASLRGTPSLFAGMGDHHLNLLRLLQDPKPQGPIAHHGTAVVKSAKLLIRRILAPYHRAIFARQEGFNANLVGLMVELCEALEDMKERFSRVEADIRRIRSV